MYAALIPDLMFEEMIALEPERRFPNTADNVPDREKMRLLFNDWPDDSFYRILLENPQ